MLLSLKKLDVYSFSCSLVAICLGISVLGGWYVHNATLIQVMPQFAPMQYNTALCMFLGGVGLAATIFRNSWLAFGCGAVIALIGFLTLLQYIFGLVVGIDELFMEAYITTKTSHPGRMAPNTALCFLLYGLAISTYSRNYSKYSKHNAVAELLSFFVLSIGLMAIAGYMQDNSAAYGWAEMSRMAVHTSLGFIVLAVGLIASIWNMRNLTQHLGVPVLLLLAILSLDLYMPLGASVGVMYVVLIFYSLRHKHVKTTYILAGISTLLIILGYYASSHDNVDLSIVYFNRLLSIIAVWITAYLVASYKKTHMQLNESKRFVDLVINKIPDIVYVKDKSSQIVMANENFWEIYPNNQEKSQAEHIAKSTFTPESLILAFEKEREAFEKGYSEVQEVILLNNDEKRVLSTKRTLFKSKNGAFILGVSRDITESQLAFEEIMRSNDELARFAFIASHDMQEPLRMVSNFTALLDEEYGDKLEGDAKKYMAFIMDGASRMQNLISDLLEYSRAGAENVMLEEFNSQEKLINTVIPNLKERIDGTKAIITMDRLPVIFASPLQFARLMQNLVGNAIKYKHPVRKPEIHIGVVEHDDHWVFSVRDNGIGIKKEYFEQIFVIFHRLHHRNEYSGTGLGLAICKKIVENFRGEIWVESESGMGSCFYFTLPKLKQ